MRRLGGNKVNNIESKTVEITLYITSKGTNTIPSFKLRTNIQQEDKDIDLAVEFMKDFIEGYEKGFIKKSVIDD